MGQKEVLDFLNEQRELNDNWFKVADIRIALEKKGYSNGCIKGLFNSLYKLASFNIIEVRGIGLWKHHKEFRAYKSDKRKN